MKKFYLGMLFGAVIVILVVIALGAIYDYNPSIARMIWPNSAKFKEVPIHEDHIFDEVIVGSIPQSYFNKTHVCELWENDKKEYVDPSWVSGIFTYNFDIDRWIYCQ